MIASAYQRPPHIYGEILSASVYQSPRSDLPGIGRFLLQGAAVGALIAFFWPVAGMLWHPENGYNFLLVSYLPLFLGAGILFGLCEGVTIWTCTYLAGRQINLVVRAVLGMVTLAILIFACDFLFAEPSPYYKDHAVTDYLYALRIYAVCGLVFGLVIGSKFRPHYELIRGTSTDRWPGLSGVTGLLLRVFVIFSLMVSILCLILSTQGDFHRQEFAFSVIAVSHFALAVVILFARIPFWLLLPLAIIVNFPIVVFLTDALPNLDGVRVLTLVYLHLWAAFLLCRFSLPQRPFSFLKKEARYYLID
ncbi:MAG TPA: hypothetical protein VJT69_06215 [Pyrinomonadaceae bacterium]|nr:hypothetical protein [Pyrinomonadaceae bacterium]